MNREFLLDSLDGLKTLVFQLLPAEVAGSVACVPMTTDGPWNEAEKTLFETVIGIPRERTHWAPGGFPNVPAAANQNARSRWVQALAAVKERYLFLDPDTGFHEHHTGRSEKMVLVSELAEMLRMREAVVIYRHQYWPKSNYDDIPPHTYPYVWHGLRLLTGAGLFAFAYQSQSASFFFVSQKRVWLAPFESGLRLAMSGISSFIVERRLVSVSRQDRIRWRQALGRSRSQ